MKTNFINYLNNYHQPYRIELEGKKVYLTIPSTTPSECPETQLEFITECLQKEYPGCACYVLRSEPVEEIRNRVKFQESISDSLKRIPFLQRFINRIADRIYFDRRKMNSYLGFKKFEDSGRTHSADINYLLMIAEQRGDLK